MMTDRPASRRYPTTLLRPLLSLSLTLGLIAPAAADWAGFRGPHGLGVSGERGLPVKWTDTDNVAWKVKLPGPGSSSPVTVGDRIFLTCFSTGDGPKPRRVLLALDRKTGKMIWEKEVPPGPADAPYQGRIQDHGYASSTPATDGERLYAFFGTAGVFAYDLDGNQLWQAGVGTRTHQWGSASSPVLAGNLVIVNAAVEGGALVAFDKLTGKEAWRTPGLRQTWCTPALVDVPGGKRELVVSMQRAVVGYDPGTGKELWRCEGIDDYVCPSVVAQDGVVYAIGGRRSAAVAVRAGGRGDVTSTHRLWTQRVGSNVPSPVVHDGHLYWVNHQGMAYCLKADTGETVYQERVPGAGQVYASAVAADGKLYAVTRNSGTFVLAAKPKFEVLARNQLGADRSVCNASPAVDGGQLLLRSDQTLYCIGRPSS
jgi:outer membrane protein assembly factor BamB